MLSSKDLNQFINDHAIAAEIVHLAQETPTVQAAAAALGVQPQQIVKSVLFLADGEPVLVVACGLSRIHRKRLADTLAISRRRVKMASAEKVLTITGFPVGTVPPFGHLTRLRTLLDEAVLLETAVYGGGGEINALMRIEPTELQRVVQGQVLDITE